MEFPVTQFLLSTFQLARTSVLTSVTAFFAVPKEVTLFPLAEESNSDIINSSPLPQQSRLYGSEAEA
jgi:hypothetical protein